MKNFRLLMLVVSALSLIGAMVLTFNGCSSEAPVQPQAVESAAESIESIALSQVNAYPQSDSIVLRLLGLLLGYEGGILHVPNGSSFEIQRGSLIPQILGLTRAVITMRVDLAQIQIPGSDAVPALIYTFGPSGSKFNPAAQAWFNWTDLGSPNAKVYYINKQGGYEELTPIRIDSKNKRMLVSISHFSRYAIAWSR